MVRHRISCRSWLFSFLLVLLWGAFFWRRGRSGVMTVGREGEGRECTFSYERWPDQRDTGTYQGAVSAREGKEVLSFLAYTGPLLDAFERACLGCLDAVERACLGCLNGGERSRTARRAMWDSSGIFPEVQESHKSCREVETERTDETSKMLTISSARREVTLPSRPPQKHSYSPAHTALHIS